MNNAYNGRLIGLAIIAGLFGLGAAVASDPTAFTVVVVIALIGFFFEFWSSMKHDEHAILRRLDRDED